MKNLTETSWCDRFAISRRGTIRKYSNTSVQLVTLRDARIEYATVAKMISYTSIISRDEDRLERISRIDRNKQRASPPGRNQRAIYRARRGATAAACIAINLTRDAGHAALPRRSPVSTRTCKGPVFQRTRDCRAPPTRLSLTSHKPAHMSVEGKTLTRGRSGRARNFFSPFPLRFLSGRGDARGTLRLRVTLCVTES